MLLIVPVQIIIHLFYVNEVNTVEPPLTATSVQWPLYFVSADSSPHIYSYLNLSRTVTSLQRQRPLTHVPSRQNNLSTTAMQCLSTTGEKVKNGDELACF